MSGLIGMPEAEPQLPTKTFGRITFTYEKKSSLYDARTCVILSEVSDNVGKGYPFKIVIDQRGITPDGTLALPLGSMDDLQSFAQLIDFAWREHRKLAPNLLESETGH